LNFSSFGTPTQRSTANQGCPLKRHQGNLFAIAQTGHIVVDVSLRELHLYRKADGACALQSDDEGPVRDFAHYVQALDIIHRIPSFRGANLTVYNVMGNTDLKTRI